MHAAGIECGEPEILNCFLLDSEPVVEDGNTEMDLWPRDRAGSKTWLLHGLLCLELLDLLHH